MPFSLWNETVSSQDGTITAEEIDAIVTAQADDDAAWEQPVSVRKTDAGSKRDPMTKRRTVSKRTKQMVMLEDEQVALLPISSDPEILSGETVFRGTRVPVAALLDNLAAGITLDEFLDNFPTVTREQALQVLEFSKNTIRRKESGVNIHHRGQL